MMQSKRGLRFVGESETIAGPLLCGVWGESDVCLADSPRALPSLSVDVR